MPASTDVSNQLRALIEHEPQYSQEIIDQAAVVMKDGIRNLALNNSLMASVIIGMLRRVFTSAQPTLAVQIAGDGFAMLMANPQYTIDLGPEQLPFVLCHEALHIVNRHLHVDPELHGDPAWTLATEATINWACQNLLNMGMPKITGPDGNEVEQGVNPKSLHKKYVEDLKKQGKDPLPFEKFISPDLVCYHELKRMTRLPKQKDSNCVHGTSGQGQGQGKGDGQGDGTGQPILDQEELDHIANQALATVMHEATANENGRARDELLKLADRTDGSETASKIWGLMGLGALRGEKVETRKVDYWRQWVDGKLATLLDEGMRLRYNKKKWWEPSLAYRGQDTKQRVCLGTDASGSMYDTVLNYVLKRVGEEDGVELTSISWDGQAYLHEPGQPFRGGGGTDIQCLIDYVEGRTPVEGAPEVDGPEFFDAVIVISDGHMAIRHVEDPSRWVWLLTAGGSPAVPEENGMDLYELPVDTEL